MLENTLLRQRLIVLRRQAQNSLLSWRDRALFVLLASWLKTALWASVMNGPPLKPQGFARHRVLRADKETDFLVVKRTTLAQIL